MKSATIFLSFITLLLVTTHTFAQSEQSFAWTDANVALIYPAGWDAPVTSADGGTLTLLVSGGEFAISVAVLPVETAEGAIQAALETQLAAVNLLPLRYNAEMLYGRGGLHVEAVSRDRTQAGLGRSGRLPDNRVLLIAGRAPASEQATIEDAVDAVLNSLVLSASLPPVMPSYHPLWRTLPNEAHIDALGFARGQLTLVDDTGVRLIDAGTGAVAAAYPFDHPAQPTGIAVDGQGVIYVGDAVCRCLRPYDGRWLDPVGSFGGGAPFSMARADDGTIYAVDKTDAGYVLRILGEPRNLTLALNFNASAPPLLALDGAGQVWLIEWLSSLIDGSTSGAVSLVDGAQPSAELQYWLEGLSPDNVRALAADASGDLALATRDRGILIVNSAGQIVERLPGETDALALTFGTDGTLYSARADGALSALTRHGTAERFGSPTLALGAPVQGVLSETAAAQTWTYAGTAGEKVTISAVDQTRTDAFTVGLDMAVRLIAPDGSEVAYDDDQAGADLFGAYDAQIPDFRLPQTGTYTVSVEWRQGSGMYTLGVSSAQTVTLSADGVTRVEGVLQDVFPVQRWTFEGHTGDVLTFTMSAEGGTLDPALALRKPDGDLLAYNDDATDLELANNSQIAQVSLPVDGTYLIDASRFEGSGRYSLVIVNTTLHS